MPPLRGKASLTVEPAKKKLYFALLNSGWLRREFASFQLPAMNHTEGVELVWESPDKTWHHPIYSNRNAIVQRFLKTDCDFLMMQDDDIVPQFNPAELVWMDRDVVGAPAKVRQDDGRLNWVAFLHTSEGMDGGGYYAIDMGSVPTNADLVPVEIVGTGLICIKRKVLEHPGMKAPFLVENDENGVCVFGTDFAFCRRAKAAGFEIFTTPHKVCEHYKETGMLEMTGYDDSDYFCHDNNKYKLHWGGWSITQRDWEFIQRVIKDEGVLSVLEFGSGLSSLLMSEKCRVLSLDTDEKYSAEIGAKVTPQNDLILRIWDGKEQPATLNFDMIFIDGPPGGFEGGLGREFSYKAAAESGARIIITHDSGRERELHLSRKYLWEKYECVGRSGLHLQRCELWMRKK